MKHLPIELRAPETEGASPGEEPEIVAAQEPENQPEAAPPEVVLPAATPPVAWQEKRIAKLTARHKENEQTIKGLREELEALKVGKPEGLDEAEISRRADERAKELATAKAWNDSCEKILKAGHQRFGEADFAKRIAESVRVINPNDQQELGKYNQFIAQLIEMEVAGPEQVIFDLWGDPANAARVLDLSPAKMAVEIQKMATKPAQGEEEVLPKPIKPITRAGGARQEIDPADKEQADRLSTAEWMRRREAQVEKARANGSRR
jgi:hypothetical protein